LEGSSGPPRANQGVSKAEPRDSHAVRAHWVNASTSPYPADLEHISKIHCRKWHHKDESFVLDISGYIQERVSCYGKHPFSLMVVLQTSLSSDSHTIDKDVAVVHWLSESLKRLAQLRLSLGFESH